MNDQFDIDAMDFSKLDGLLPAVVQHAATGAVLMVGFMNREAVERTIKEKRATFWSRSRRQLWQKGETSGNFLNVVSMHADCDNDSILIKATPEGPVCHTGAATCFGGEERFLGSVLGRLQEIVAERKQRLPEQSYTTKLFKEGTARISQKVGEEGVELALASVQNNAAAIKEESADLLYHLIVLLQQHGMRLEDIEEVLLKRMKEK